MYMSNNSSGLVDCRGLDCNRNGLGFDSIRGMKCFIFSFPRSGNDDALTVKCCATTPRWPQFPILAKIERLRKMSLKTKETEEV